MSEHRKKVYARVVSCECEHFCIHDVINALVVYAQLFYGITVEVCEDFNYVECWGPWKSSRN